MAPVSNLDLPNPYLGKFEWKMLVYIMTILKFYGHWVYFMVIWNILWPVLVHFSCFGMLWNEQSGNSGPKWPFFRSKTAVALDRIGC
jgi:hypothetical protein